MLTGNMMRYLQNVRYFRCPLWQTKKSKPARKLKHTNSILEYFEYFCEMSRKSILTILSYTISKLVRFFLRHSVETRIAADSNFSGGLCKTHAFCKSSYWPVRVIQSKLVPIESVINVRLAVVMLPIYRVLIGIMNLLWLHYNQLHVWLFHVYHVVP